jgi:hypothetical protein
MNKKELKQLIKEEIEKVSSKQPIKEVSTYKFTDSEEYKMELKQFIFILSDLNGRYIKKNEAILRMRDLLEKFTGKVVDWAEGEAYNEIGDINQTHQEYAEE